MRTLILALVGATLSLPVVAQSLKQELQHCRATKDSLERLVCYDRLAKRAAGLADVTLPTGQESGNTRVKTPARQPESQFGLHQKMDSNLSSTIKEVREQGHYTHLYLENGQVWKITDSEHVILKAGNAIVIEPGMFGAFYLSKSGTNRRYKVKRVK